MGMFDWIRIGDGVKLPGFPSRMERDGFQTKSLLNICAIFSISNTRERGTNFPALRLEEIVPSGYSDGEEFKAPIYCTFSGEIIFYNDSFSGKWYEYRAIFDHGKVVLIEKTSKWGKAT